MSNNDLAPWAHKKSREWNEAVLKRSGFMTGLENFFCRPAHEITIGQCRMVLMFLIVLGRPGIWPDNYRDILELIEKKVSEVAETSQEFKKTRLTLAEHQFRTAVLSEIQQELEILRRRVGKSRLKSRVKQPETWNSFWN